MSKILSVKLILVSLISLNVLLSARWALDGNLFFHTDIARDFLLIEDIVKNNHLSLIGPRSGAIPGVFHGPLWLYLNVPAFIVGNGDPSFVAWFWVGLLIISLLIIYWVGKRLLSEQEGLLAALLLSSVTILNIRALFNPYGALIISPLFLYFFSNYINTKQFKSLILALATLGIIIQFQMAFGVPILALSILFLFYYLIKNKLTKHIVAFAILFIPLSTYILFDLRNNYLQINSVLNYVKGIESHGKLDLGLIQIVELRIRELVLNGLGSITQSNNYLSMILLSLFIFGLIKFKKSNIQLVHYLFLYFYGGFWILTCLFKGPVWGYYYLPFIPLLILMFVSFKRIINKWLFYIIFAIIYLLNLQVGARDMLAYDPNPLNQDVSTWKFNQYVAKEIFNQPEKEFGYFIFTPDLYGYTPRYALNFYESTFKEKQVFPYQKKDIVYLIIAPPPEYGKDPNSLWYQKNINSTKWKQSDIKLDRGPDYVVSFKNGFSLEKYNLSEEEKSEMANPYLIQGIFFR